MSIPDIRLAENHPDREAVYAFRYQVIVKELKLDLPTVDHSRRIVIDPEDATGHLFVACQDGVVVGTVRMNLLRDGPVEPHVTLMGLAQLSLDEWRASSVTSRLLVTTTRRRTPLGIRLAQACYRHYRRVRLEWDHILVNSVLVRMYTRLGYTLFGGSVIHPEIGEVYPMRLELNNEQHLRATGSVFTRCWEDEV
jgi:hypothetical protein